jgi:hypothetical protein
MEVETRTRFVLIATEKNGKSDQVTSSILLMCIGKKGREMCNTLTFEEEDKDKDKMKYDVITGTFDGYCSPRKYYSSTLQIICLSSKER